MSETLKIFLNAYDTSFPQVNMCCVYKDKFRMPELSDFVDWIDCIFSELITNIIMKIADTRLFSTLKKRFRHFFHI